MWSSTLVHRLVLAMVLATGPAAPAPTGPSPQPSSDDVWVVSLPPASSPSTAPAAAQVVEESRPVEAAVFSVVEGVKSILRSNEEGQRGPHSAPLADLAVVNPVNPATASLEAALAAPSDINELAVNPAWEAQQDPVDQDAVDQPAVNQDVPEILEAIPSPDTTTLLDPQILLLATPGKKNDAEAANDLAPPDNTPETTVGHQDQDAPSLPVGLPHSVLPAQEVPAVVPVQDIAASLPEKAPLATLPEILSSSEEGVIPTQEELVAESLQQQDVSSEAGSESTDEQNLPSIAVPETPLVQDIPTADLSSVAVPETPLVQDIPTADLSSVAVPETPLVQDTPSAAVPETPLVQDVPSVAITETPIVQDIPSVAVPETPPVQKVPSVAVAETPLVQDVQSAEVSSDAIPETPLVQHVPETEVSFDAVPETPLVQDVPTTDVPSDAVPETPLVQDVPSVAVPETPLVQDVPAVDVPSDAVPETALVQDVPSVVVPETALVQDVPAADIPSDAVPETALVQDVPSVVVPETALVQDVPAADIPSDAVPETPLVQDVPSVAVPETPLVQDVPSVAVPETPLVQNVPSDAVPETAVVQDVPSVAVSETPLVQDVPSVAVPETPLVQDVPSVVVPETAVVQDVPSVAVPETPLVQDVPSDAVPETPLVQDVPSVAVPETPLVQNVPAAELPTQDIISEALSEPSLTASQEMPAEQDLQDIIPNPNQSDGQQEASDRIPPVADPPAPPAPLAPLAPSGANSDVEQQVSAEAIEAGPGPTGVQQVTSPSGSDIGDTLMSPQRDPAVTVPVLQSEAEVAALNDQLLPDAASSDAEYEGSLSTVVPASSEANDDGEVLAPQQLHTQAAEINLALLDDQPEVSDAVNATQPEPIATTPSPDTPEEQRLPSSSEGVQDEPAEKDVEALEEVPPPPADLAPEGTEAASLQLDEHVENEQTTQVVEVAAILADPNDVPQQGPQDGPLSTSEDDVQTPLPEVSQTNDEPQAGLEFPAMVATEEATVVTQDVQQDVPTDVPLDATIDAPQASVLNDVPQRADAVIDVPSDVLLAPLAPLAEDLAPAATPLDEAATTLPPVVQPAGDLADIQDEPTATVESIERPANEDKPSEDSAPDTTPLDVDALQSFNAELSAGPSTQPAATYEPGAQPTLPANLPALADAEEATSLIAAINELHETSQAGQLDEAAVEGITTDAPAYEVPPPTERPSQADEVKAPGEPFLNPDDPGNPYKPDTEEELNAILEETIVDEDGEKSQEQTQQPSDYQTQSTDQTQQPTIGLNDEQTQQPTIGPNYEQTQQPTIGLNDEQTQQPTIGLYDEQTQQPTINPNDEQTQQPTIGLKDEQTQLPTIGLNDEQTQQPTIGLYDEQTQQSTINPNDEQTQQPAIGLNDEQTQASVVTSEDQTQQPNLEEVQEENQISQSQGSSSEESTNHSSEEKDQGSEDAKPSSGSSEEQNSSSAETNEGNKPAETTPGSQETNNKPEDVSGTTATSEPPAVEETQSAVGEDSDSDKPQPVSVKWLRLRSEVQLRFAHTLVRAALENPAARAQEVQLQLSMPDTAYVTGMSIESEGQTYKAYVRERKKADSEYQQAALSGQTAAQVRQTSVRDSSVMSLVVTVAPRSALTVNLTYEELLGRRRGRYHHAVGIDPGQDVGEVRVDVYILESRNISSLAVCAAGRELYSVDERDLSNGLQNYSSGPLVVRRAGGNKAHIQVLASREQQLQLWSPDKAQPSALPALPALPVPGLSFTYDVDRSDTASGDLLLMDGYFVHFFAPPEVPPLRKHAIFVLDTSGSMWGHKLRQLQTAMTRILDSLHPDDFFSIVQFSSHVTEWSPHTLEVVGLRDKEATLPANKDHINKAKKFINSMEASGGTNIGGALRSAVRLAGKRDYDRWPTYRAGSADRPQPIIVFLTDGLPTVGTLSLGRVLAQTRAQNAEIKAAVFSLSFGTRSNWRFLQRLSLQNDGFARRIYEAGDAAQQLQDFYQEISSPLLANVTFNYVTAKVDGVTVTRRSFPLLYGGSELVVAGRVADGVQSLEAEVEVWGAAPGASAAVGAAPGRRLLRTQAITARATRVDNIVGLKPPPLPNKKKGTEKPAIGLLERLWAYLSVKQLLEVDLAKHEDDVVDQPPKTEPGLDQPRRRALYLALKYGFVTRVTSLVAVKPGLAANGTISRQEAPIRPVPADGGAEKDAENLSGNNKFEIPLTRPGPGHVPISFKPLLLAQQAENATQSLPLTAISWLSQHTDSSGRLRLGAAAFSLEVPPRQELQRLMAAAANQCPGRSCKPLASCVQTAVADSFMVFRDFFCPLGTYAGVCCSI